jgi:hypothetical protein
MSAPNTASTEPTRTAKRRSPVERTIVWGLIAVLLVVVLWEGWARYGYSRTLDKWQDAIAKAESADSTGGVSRTAAEEMLAGSPTISGPQQEGRFQTVTYRWKSLLKEYSIAVSYVGDPPEITDLVTADAPEEEQPAPVVSGPDDEEDEEEGDEDAERPPRKRPESAPTSGEDASDASTEPAQPEAPQEAPESTPNEEESP